LVLFCGQISWPNPAVEKLIANSALRFAEDARQERRGLTPHLHPSPDMGGASDRMVSTKTDMREAQVVFRRVRWAFGLVENSTSRSGFFDANSAALGAAQRRQKPFRRKA
jgi:hypothetical protein